ncbi:unnamed protein product [Candidula unifasciata]|uniref:FERM domain-containing protein n=1 Tax=Candidula unifasciata TaxID=100452 RepID=A0A8S3Z4N1_9EUPU|nr:unnamed protein product [Candidula unifasciata]
MDVMVAVIRPKQGHSGQGYKPQLYEILLLDSKTPPGEKVKPAKYLPMFQMKVGEEEPRALVLTQVQRLTNIKGERALQVQWSSDVSASHRESLSQFCLYFVPVSPNEKINKRFADQAQNAPGFYPLDYVTEVVNNGSINFPSSTKKLLQHLESWLKEKHIRPNAIECMFRAGAEYRIHFTVHNPVFIPSRITSDTNTGGGGTPAPQEVVKVANEALAKMLFIEKCETVVINPLFGSNLEYKTKPNSYVINQHWPSIPQYDKIIAATLPGPSWKVQYPLHSYAAAGDKTEVEILLKQGYPHSQLDSVSCAPIHYAAWYGCISVVETLLGAGCSPNLLDGTNSTALHIAAKKGNEQLAQCLLQCPDIDLNIKDKDGKRALDICLSVPNKTMGHEQVEQLVREAADRPNYTVEVFLMDKTSKNLMLTSGFRTTVQQLNEQMMKEFNLPKNYSDIFTLWIGSKSLELQLKLEYEVVKALQQYNTRTVHMLTDSKNPSEEEPVLTWRRNVKVSVEKEKQLQHTKALDLLFHEAYHNYISGLYPCKDKDAVTFATILLCLQHQETTRVKPALSNLSQNQLKELIPAAILRHKDTSHWVNKISKEYPNVRDTPQQQLKSQFLTACQRLTVYGSAFFMGTIISPLRKAPTSCYVGVNDIGIHIIGLHTKQMVQSMVYREITWKHIAEKTMLEIRIIRPVNRNPRDSSTRGVIEIRTRQAGLIDHLMQQLDRMHGDYSNR